MCGGLNHDHVGDRPCPRLVREALEKRFAAFVDCGVPFTWALEESPCSAVATSTSATAIVAPHAASVRFGWSSTPGQQVLEISFVGDRLQDRFRRRYSQAMPNSRPAPHAGVLGDLHARPPGQQKVASSVGFMWSFPHSALYAEPARLVHLGLLTEVREEHGRRRRLYALTGEGRSELERLAARAALRAPAAPRPRPAEAVLLQPDERERRPRPGRGAGGGSPEAARCLRGDRGRDPRRAGGPVPVRHAPDGADVRARLHRVLGGDRRGSA